MQTDCPNRLIAGYNMEEGVHRTQMHPLPSEVNRSLSLEPQKSKIEHILSLRVSDLVYFEQFA